MQQQQTVSIQQAQCQASGHEAHFAHKDSMGHTTRQTHKFGAWNSITGLGQADLTRLSEQPWVSSTVATSTTLHSNKLATMSACGSSSAT